MERFFLRRPSPSFSGAAVRAFADAPDPSDGSERFDVLWFANPPGFPSPGIVLFEYVLERSSSIQNRLAPNTDRLLKGLGVDRILNAYPAGSLPENLGDLSRLVDELRPVEAAPHGEREMAAMMFDAHETLTRVDPENIQRFKDVLSFLRKDLDRRK